MTKSLEYLVACQVRTPIPQDSLPLGTLWKSCKKENLSVMRHRSVLLQIWLGAELSRSRLACKSQHMTFKPAPTTTAKKRVLEDLWHGTYLAGDDRAHVRKVCRTVIAHV